MKLPKLKNRSSVKEIAAIVRKELKNKYPNYKFSVRSTHNHLDLHLLEADFNPFTAKAYSKDYLQLGAYANIKDNDSLSNRGKEVMKYAIGIAEHYNWDNSDSMTDYFDVNFYSSYGVGKWDRPFKVVKKTTKAKPAAKKTSTKTSKAVEGIEIINYSEKSLLLKGEGAKQIKDKLKDLGAKWNNYKKGWFLKKTKRAELESFLKIKDKSKEVKSEKLKVESKEVESENTKVESKKVDETHNGLSIPIKLSDLDYKLAKEAHHGTSFDPEKRALQAQKEYYNDMVDFDKTFKPKAKNDMQRSIFISRFKGYKEMYLKLDSALLSAKSRIISPMISGPANFPVRRNEKANNVADKRRNEFLDKVNKYFDNTGKMIEDAKAPDEKASDEWNSFKKGIANSILVVKGIDNGTERGYSRRLFTSSIQNKIKTAAKNGNHELVKKALDFVKQEQGTMSKKIFADNNSVWDLLKVAEQFEQREQKKQETAQQAAKYKGVEIVRNFDADRLQILFDDKPCEDLRKELKQKAFRWSPFNKAWQRKNTNSALYDAENIVAEHFDKVEQESNLIEPNKKTNMKVIKEKTKVKVKSKGMTAAELKATMKNLPKAKFKIGDYVKGKTENTKHVIGFVYEVNTEGANKYRLKDAWGGKEKKWFYENDLKKGTDNKTKVKIKKTDPKFKVGEWVKYKDNKKIGKVVSVERAVLEDGFDCHLDWLDKKETYKGSIHESLIVPLTFDDKMKIMQHDELPDSHPLMVVGVGTPRFKEALDEYIENWDTLKKKKVKSRTTMLKKAIDTNTQSLKDLSITKGSKSETHKTAFGKDIEGAIVVLNKERFVVKEIKERKKSSRKNHSFEFNNAKTIEKRVNLIFNSSIYDIAKTKAEKKEKKPFIDEINQVKELTTLWLNEVDAIINNGTKSDMEAIKKLMLALIKESQKNDSSDKYKQAGNLQAIIDKYNLNKSASGDGWKDDSSILKV